MSSASLGMVTFDQRRKPKNDVCFRVDGGHSQVAHNLNPFNSVPRASLIEFPDPEQPFKHVHNVTQLQ